MNQILTIATNIWAAVDARPTQSAFVTTPVGSFQKTMFTSVNPSAAAAGLRRLLAKKVNFERNHCLTYHLGNQVGAVLRCLTMRLFILTIASVPSVLTQPANASCHTASNISSSGEKPRTPYGESTGPALVQFFQKFSQNVFNAAIRERLEPGLARNDSLTTR
jgi:hypothetical protein